MDITTQFPLPWHVGSYGFDIKAANGLHVDEICSASDEDGDKQLATLICRAVNSHDALVRALDDCNGCVAAAEAEGLHEIIAELRGSSDLAERLIDLVERRLIYVSGYAQPVLAIARGEA